MLQVLTFRSLIYSYGFVRFIMAFEQKSPRSRTLKLESRGDPVRAINPVLILQPTPVFIHYLLSVKGERLTSKKESVEELR